MQVDRGGNDDENVQAQAAILERLAVRDWRDARYIHWPELIGLVRQELDNRSSFRQTILTAFLTRVSVMAANNLVGLPEPARSEAVHDVVNMTVDKVLLEPPTDFVLNRFNVWLPTQCKHVARHMTRQSADSRRTQAASDIDIDLRAEKHPKQPTAEQRDDSIDIRQALLSLPPDLWRPLVLRHLDGLPVESKDNEVETISKVLNVSPRTVRNRLEQAKKILGDRLQGAA